MKRLIAGLFVLTLAACGVDGGPLRPSGHVGVSYGSNGMDTTCSMTGSNSTVSLTVVGC